jgi:hypothetical protein
MRQPMLISPCLPTHMYGRSTPSGPPRFYTRYRMRKGFARFLDRKQQRLSHYEGAKASLDKVQL